MRTGTEGRQPQQLQAWQAWLWDLHRLDHRFRNMSLREPDHSDAERENAVFELRIWPTITAGATFAWTIWMMLSLVSACSAGAGGGTTATGAVTGRLRRTGAGRAGFWVCAFCDRHAEPMRPPPSATPGDRHDCGRHAGADHQRHGRSFGLGPCVHSRPGPVQHAGIGFVLQRAQRDLHFFHRLEALVGILSKAAVDHLLQLRGRIRRDLRNRPGFIAQDRRERGEG